MNSKKSKNSGSDHMVKRLKSLVNNIPGQVSEMPEIELSYKASPVKWSKKEILGHLCDSAVNNLVRFVRAQYEPEPFALIAYAQDEWVKANNYHEKDIEEIINLWITLNNQLICVVEEMPEEKLSVTCDMEEKGLKKLSWIIEDYLAHMEYHLEQIVPEETYITYDNHDYKIPGRK